MKRRKIASGSSSNTLRIKPVGEVIASLPTEIQGLVFEIKSRMRDLGGVEEKVMYDGLAKEEVPAFNLGKRQLFHLHIESEKHGKGMAGTVSINVKDFEPYLMDSHAVSQNLKKVIASQKVYRGTKWVFIPLNSMDEVEEFLDLIKLKYEFYKFGGE